MAPRSADNGIGIEVRRKPSDIQAIKPDTEPQARVTIDALAGALGLAKSTVSRAMNGYPDISESTRLRVKKMAESLNYQPLSHAQAMTTGRTRSIALVLKLSDHDAQRPFLAEFLAGLSEGASAQNFTLTVASADNHQHLIETFHALLRDRKADGFILPRTMVHDPRIQTLRAARAPFILFGRQENPDGCSWYDIRGEDAMRDAVLHLAKLGHRRIGFINGGLIYHYASLRLAGFLRGCAEAGIEVSASMIKEDAVTAEDGARAAQVLLNHDTPPTAIVCAVDRVALGVYRAAEVCGLQIGQDLSVIGYDGIEEGGHVQPALSTFSVNNRAAGWYLADLLIQQIQGEPLESLRMSVAADFLDRGSTGPAPKCETH